jgi:hypothetical protein
MDGGEILMTMPLARAGGAHGPPGGGGVSAADARQIEELAPGDSLRLLGSVPFGRVVFSHRALPAVRPVNHRVDGDRIIIRANLGSAISDEVGVDGGTVVAYEGDMLDSAARTGWSVVVVGRARRISDESGRYSIAPHSWVSGTLEELIAIQAEIVTGFRLVPIAGPR